MAGLAQYRGPAASVGRQPAQDQAVLQDMEVLADGRMAHADGRFITWSAEGAETAGGVRVRLQPLWKWLLAPDFDS